MAITALPDSTIHLLGSAQALTTPASLVKELIDNALDAKATSVDILISPNAIDKIEVRDNGYGIAQEDLDSLGRRGHTSKLRSFDELKSIGGISLGFRGEALASAVQLGVVSVTTRTEGETVATCVQLKAPGGIASQSRASHPVGTKVCVTKFLNNLPVRKQTAEKEAAKTVKKIKELLQSYACARPKVRFCLKVASGGKGSWSFTPRANDGMKEVVSQIIGRDAAAQCIERSFFFSEKSSQVKLNEESRSADLAQSTEIQISDSRQFLVEVFMPKPKATSVGHGQYISIDTRPVAHDKGTMRKLVSIYKYYVKGSILEGEEKLRDPFLRLNINCPVSSYDPNVEPAKDDVIFQNEPLVLESIEQLFKEVYGEPIDSSVSAVPKGRGKELEDFELLMSRSISSQKPPVPANNLNAGHKERIILTESAVVSDRARKPKIGGLLPLNVEVREESESREGWKWDVDMSKDLSEDVEDIQRQNQSSRCPVSRYSPELDIRATPENSLNPWTISKMTAPLRHKNDVTPTLASAPILLQNASHTMRNYLPIPHHSSDPVSTDAESLASIRVAPPRHVVNRDDISILPEPSSLSTNREPRRQSDQPFMLNPILYSKTAESDDGLMLGEDSETFRKSKNDFHSARAIFDGSMQRFPRQSDPRKSKGMNMPFVPPIRAGNHIEPQDDLRQTTLEGGITHKAPGQNGRVPTSLDPDQNDELAWAMDFEHRKENATRHRRKEIVAARAEAKAEAEAELVAPTIRRGRRLQNSNCYAGGIDTDETSKSPHKNRYNAAIANLETNEAAPGGEDAAKQSFKTSLPDGDPRAYLMRRQKSLLPSVRGGLLKPMRAKSTRLPLERIPQAQNMHNVLLKCPVDIGTIQDCVGKISTHDQYVRGANQSNGLQMSVSEAEMAEKRVQKVVEKWMERCPKKRDDVNYDFEN
ncbi:hypothetical protein WAI453_006976 [Rhynchosporium graminicola]|uniref:Related to DNA mismatch repair protein PMS2 n=1 Tax=Rhynchosporium graminicola TaxID=2792576 RepID=A0A1E1KTY9_9HELO|nr:related to DNA mismatch repair protein PMS2 [Rhynchosporium commune]